MDNNLKNKIFISIIAGCLYLIAPVAFSASFDCGKAKSTVEKAICSNDELGKLDEELAGAYKLAVKEYPVQNYVKARQREWIKDNNYCDKNQIVSCLKANYEKRISKLKDIAFIKVYSNTQKFEYSDGDAVAEIRKKDGKFQIDVWGGFRIHRQSSNEAGKPVYTGCEFEGIFTSPNGGKATGLISGSAEEVFEFKIVGNKITYTDDRQNCIGFGSLPENLVLIGK